MSDANALEALFNAIRKAALPGQWSSGITLAREKKVFVESDDGDEVTLRVIAGNRGKTQEVTFFPGDLEWQCDCSSKLAVCEHAVASILTLRQGDGDSSSSETARTTPPAPTPTGGGPQAPRPSSAPPARQQPAQPQIARLAYRLGRDGDALTFERTLVSQGREQIWTHPLNGAPPPNAPTIISTQADMKVERVIGQWRRGKIPRNDMMQLLDALSGADTVTFERAPVRISKVPLLPRLIIEDAGRNFIATLVPDPSANLRFRNGVALVGDTLRPIDDAAGIPEGDRRQLVLGRNFTDSQSRQLHTLRGQLEKLGITIDAKTRRLKQVEGEAPHLVIESSIDEDDRLVVFPTLVYGNPPTARIDRGNLTMLHPETPLPVRDEDEENRLTQRLWNVLQLEPGRRSAFEGERATAMANKVAKFEAAKPDNHYESFFTSSQLTPHLSFSPNGIIDLSFDADGQPASNERVLKAWSRGTGFALLDDGAGYSSLPPRWMAQFGPILMGLIQAKDDKGELPTSAVADVVALCEALGKPVPERFEKLRVLVDKFDQLPRAQLPNDLRANLRHYQQEGVDWLAFHRDAGLGALLADDMGLGKTLQALCSVRGRTLVVAPTSVLPNWLREAEKFRPSLKVQAYHGANRQLDPNADLTITSWALLRLDIEQLAAVQWDAVILDEAQTIKNPDSQVARAAFRLSGSAAQRIALSGTPVENRLDDLWSQLRFLQPSLLGDRKEFAENYIEPIEKGDANAAARLRQRIRPFVLRRLKREVAPELPPRTELVMRCELTTDERQVYDAIHATTSKEVMDSLSQGGSVIAALEALLRLRQVASHRGMVPGQEAVASSSKTDLLVDLLDELTGEGHKVLVFSQWTSMLDRIEPHLESAKIAFTRLDGSTADRGAVVDTFQASDGPPVMLLSLKAGGTGLNLTAADHVVILDPWWNPAVEDQAADRAHRIGQDKPVFVHRLIAADTVEEKILALQDKKRQLADAALGQAAGVTALTRDDLMELLR